ncbi:MAG: NAD(P)/FAD-dependent oxidoreductase [Pirellulales bacterium]
MSTSEPAPTVPPARDVPAARYEVIVIGAGAAGLMAAAAAAHHGARTLLLEKNRKPGVKILMSGGTRCNITQATDNRGIVAAFGRQGQFLHSPLAAFGVEDTLRMFAAEGVPTKVEPTGKVFPVSDKATDVLAALLHRLERSGCELALNEGVTEVTRVDGAFRLQTAQRTLGAARLVITTGGQSYPGCGTTGEGYHWARGFGHTIVAPRPALVPITTHAAWVRALQGVTIADVAVRVLESTAPIGSTDAADSTDAPAARSSAQQRPLATRRGSFLFTHFGLSGPVVLDVSRVVSGHAQPQRLVLECDFLPAVPRAQLEQLLRERVASAGKRQLASLLPEEVPKRLAEALVAVAGLSLERKAAELGAHERSQLIEALKQVRIPISGTRGFAKAEVTAGGIALDEVDSRSMQSKRVPNLFLAGEVLDLDGPIGGYNFQAAWSTGHLAGLCAAGGE